MKQTLSDSIDDYRAHRESMGLAKSTMLTDVNVLRRFLTVVGNILTENVHEGHVDQYFTVAAQKRSPRSLALDTAVLKGFFSWAIRTRRAGRNGNPAAGRRAPKAPPREWRGFSVQKVPAMLDSATHPRDRMLLALAIFLLGRSIEFTLLRIADVNLDAGYISYRIPKTHKVDLLPISEELDEELRRWLKFYAEEVGGFEEVPLDPNWYLVPRKTAPLVMGSGPLNRTVVKLRPECRMKNPHRVAQKALQAIGFPLVDAAGNRLNEGMHTIRRSMARALYEQLRDEGDVNPVETVRSMLNHATEAQTRAYIGLQSERIHRDTRLRGRPMFPGLRPGNVTSLDEVRRARELVGG